MSLLQNGWRKTSVTSGLDNFNTESADKNWKSQQWSTAFPSLVSSAEANGDISTIATCTKWLFQQCDLCPDSQLFKQWWNQKIPVARQTGHPYYPPHVSTGIRHQSFSRAEDWSEVEQARIQWCYGLPEENHCPYHSHIQEECLLFEHEHVPSPKPAPARWASWAAFTSCTLLASRKYFSHNLILLLSIMYFSQNSTAYSLFFQNHTKWWQYVR